jgi:hypothetical protein
MTEPRPDGVDIHQMGYGDGRNHSTAQSNFRNAPLLERTGACQRVLEYENVNFISGVVDRQTSEPDASIVLKRPGCHQIAETEMKIPMTIQRPKTNPKPHFPPPKNPN